MHKKAYLVLSLVFVSCISWAQTTYLPLGSDDYLLLDRLETLSGRLSDTLCLSDKVEGRKNAVNFVSSVMQNGGDSTHANPAVTKIDMYNMRQLISENGEWAADEHGVIPSKHPWFRTFYKNQYNYIYIKTKDFFLIMNPVLNVMSTVQRNDPSTNLSLKGMSGTLGYNSHDFEVRGWVSKKVGFYSLLTDNQEVFPAFWYGNVNKPHRAVPGASYFFEPANRKAGAYAYLNAAAYIDFAVIKNHINLTFGSGKHFIGDGITSLLLTDFSGNIPFLQLRTRFWRFNYDCLYQELTAQYDKNLGDAVYNHKFNTIHYLTLNANRWLTLGYFESIVFDRPNVYEVNYLNPVIMAYSINLFNGSGDKSLLGFTAKALVAKHFQFYGQLMLNEYRSKELFSNRGWYGNKWGVQAGMKYFDAFGIKNLDLQGEVDAVRPYSYTAQDTLDNYTNYNQPLADPLGAGFIKSIGLLRYQPVKNLTISMKGMYYVQGADTGSKNYGNTIFSSYLVGTNGSNTYGVRMINGPKVTCMSMDLNISYQLFRNFFIDAGGLYRKYTADATTAHPYYSTIGKVEGPMTTTYYYLGFRINAPRRDYSQF